MRTTVYNHRLIPLVLVVAAATMFFASCKKSGGDEGGQAGPGGRMWNFTIVKFEELQQTEDTERGLRVGLRDVGLVEGKDFEITSMNAHGDVPVLRGLFDKVAAGSTDLLISLQTSTLHTAIKRVDNTPIVFMVVASPFVISTVGVNDSVHLPNVTGVYTNTTFDRMLAYIKECMPKAKRIGTLFSSLEMNATYYKSQLITAAAKHGMTVDAIDVSTKADVAPAVNALCSRTPDAICQIEDNLTSAMFPIIAQTARKYNLPVFSFVNEQARTGSSIVFAPDYYESAKEAAETIAQIMKGTKVAAIPFRRIDKFHLIVNSANAKAVGLTIPPSVLAQADSVIAQ